MILEASKNHLEQIFFIEKNSFSQPWSRNMFEHSLKNLNSINWVYIVNGQVIAYLFGEHILDEFHIENIAVLQEYRYMGIGLDLLMNMEKYLSKLSVMTVLLEVNSSNLPARKLYEKVGFIVNGKRNNYYGYGDDAILYTWYLND